MNSIILASTILFVTIISFVAGNVGASKSTINNNATDTIIDYNEFADTETYFFNEENTKVSLDQYEGQTIILVFWATWCNSCEKELKLLDNLAKDFRKLPFKIIALSEDKRGTEVIKAYFQEKEIRYLEIFRDYNNQMFKSMSVIGLPTGFLIDSNGKIKKMFKGSIKWHKQEIREQILQIIGDDIEMPKNTYKASFMTVTSQEERKEAKNVKNPDINNDTTEKQNENSTKGIKDEDKSNK